MEQMKFLFCLTSKQRAEAALFLKICCFFLSLVGRFHNFELMQNIEKTRNGLRKRDYIIFLDQQYELFLVLLYKKSKISQFIDLCVYFSVDLP
jgi:hypothetical protein